MVATSATRDAANSRRIHRTGHRRARRPAGGHLGRRRSTALLRRRDRRAGWYPAGPEDECPPPYLVTDIGGGSTEFILGGPTEIVGARSVNIGCVRLTERHLHDDPPLPDQVADTTGDIDDALTR